MHNSALTLYLNYSLLLSNRLSTLHYIDDNTKRRVVTIISKKGLLSKT